MIYEVRGENTGWVRVDALSAMQAFRASIRGEGHYVGEADGFWVYEKSGHLYKVRAVQMTREDLVKKIDGLCLDLKDGCAFVDDAIYDIMLWVDKYVEGQK